MVAAGTPLHRRCRACHVADRRGRNQLGSQDAVASVNILGAILVDRAPSEPLGSADALTLPWPLKPLRRWPYLRRIPARIVGVGFRPEHVKTPQVRPVR
jgi:hypothetical protein